MRVKLFEIRDSMTCISALAVRLDGEKTEAERWLLARCGFDTTAEAQARFVLLLHLSGESGHWSCDPYAWPTRARTFPVAQEYINAHFDELESGAVVDVEFLAGETPAPKTSDRLAEIARGLHL